MRLAAGVWPASIITESFRILTATNASPSALAAMSCTRDGPKAALAPTSSTVSSQGKPANAAGQSVEPARSMT